MEQNPLISIIIPVYNGEKWLSHAVKSAIRQTYRNIEIIIVNDGSTDRSLLLCQSFCNDNRVKLFSKKNGGQASARNFGLKQAKGEYIQFLDCDDTLVEDSCKVAADTLRENTDFVLFGFNVYNHGTLLRKPNPKTYHYGGG